MDFLKLSSKFGAPGGFLAYFRLELGNKSIGGQKMILSTKIIRFNSKIARFHSNRLNFNLRHVPRTIYAILHLFNSKNDMIETKTIRFNFKTARFHSES